MTNPLFTTHWVYRIYHPDTRQLLWVGQTCELTKRVRAHVKRSPWFPCETYEAAIELGIIDSETHNSWEASLLGEKWAIETLNPFYNIDRLSFERQLEIIVDRCKDERRWFDFSTVRRAIGRLS